MRSLLKTMLFAATIAASCVGAARADVLYSDGPIRGHREAWDITDFWLSDSFTLSAPATVSGFDLTVWVLPGDTFKSVSWSIGSAAFGTDLGSGSGTVTEVTDYGINGFGYDVATYLLSGLNLSLASGTDWLTLTNAVTAQAGEAYWDENDGPSQAYEGTSPETAFPLAGSQTFDINGPSSAPEPASVALLALGLTGLAAAPRRRRA